MDTYNGNVDAVVERLDDLFYDLRDFDLLRYRDCDTDAQMREMVATLKTWSASQRTEVFETSSEAQHLFETYGERATLAALRSSSLAGALDAFDARLVTPRIDFERWRRDALFTAYVAMSLGAMEQSLTAPAEMLGEAILIEIVQGVVDNVSRVEQILDVGRLDVTTHYGRGIISSEMVRHAPSSGILSIYPTAPILTKSADQHSETQAAVAVIAVGLADELETAPAVLAHSIGFSDFPDDALHHAGLRFSIDVSTCLSIMLFSEDSQQDVVELFVAELASDAQVSEIVDLVAEMDDEESFVAATGAGSYIAMLFAVPDLGTPSDDDNEDFPATSASETPTAPPPVLDLGSSAYFSSVQRALRAGVAAASRPS